MKSATMLKPELEEGGYGSSFDPVLTGVADGLARLFPPVHDLRGSEREADAPERKTHACAADTPRSVPRS